MCLSHNALTLRSNFINIQRECRCQCRYRQHDWLDIMAHCAYFGNFSTCHQHKLECRTHFHYQFWLNEIMEIQSVNYRVSHFTVFNGFNGIDAYLKPKSMLLKERRAFFRFTQRHKMWKIVYVCMRNGIQRVMSTFDAMMWFCR